MSQLGDALPDAAVERPLDTLPVPSLLLLHGQGSDAEALRAYLTKVGFHVSTFATLEALEARVLADSPRVTAESQGDSDGGVAAVVLAEDLLPGDDADLGLLLGFLERYPVLVLGRRRPMPARPRLRRLDDPYFLQMVTAEIQALLSSDGPVPAIPSTPPIPLPPREDAPAAGNAPDLGLVLRGLVHALNNPLSAASGWLQLLAVDLQREDPKWRALHQARTELQRMERLLLALGWIGGRSSNLRVKLNVEQQVKDRIDALEREGLAVSMTCEGESLPCVYADPAEFGMMLDLLFGSFLEERNRLRGLYVVIRVRKGHLEVIIGDGGGSLLTEGDASDLGVLLRRMRHTRAIAIALAHRVVALQLGGSVSLTGGGGEASRLILSMPATERREVAVS
jgi:signal transduction histidine kinase